MEIIQTPTELVRYFEGSEAVSRQQAILVDRYLEGVEVELDAVCDGEDVIIPGIMQHVERAGVHSGDSLAVYPALSLSEDEIETARRLHRPHRQSVGPARPDEYSVRDNGWRRLQEPGLRPGRPNERRIGPQKRPNLTGIRAGGEPAIQSYDSLHFESDARADGETGGRGDARPLDTRAGVRAGTCA